METLENKTAVVTGAASGIGLAIVRRFARAGAKLVMSDIDDGRLKQALNEVTELGATAVGVTADIAARAVQHREGKGGSFIHRYGLARLVYLEGYDYITDAIAREKAVKKWNRAWKIRAIEERNPEWHDLFDTLNM